MTYRTVTESMISHTKRITRRNQNFCISHGIYNLLSFCALCMRIIDCMRFRETHDPNMMHVVSSPSPQKCVPVELVPVFDTLGIEWVLQCYFWNYHLSSLTLLTCRCRNPDGSKIKEKMVYASSRQALAEALGNIKFRQVSSISELERETIKQEVLKDDRVDFS